LSGELAGRVGDTVIVDVKRPGKTHWSYSSARACYVTGASPGGLEYLTVSWWYRYVPNVRGVYYFSARFDGDSRQLPCSSKPVHVTVR
jgi:hypothetical protein